MTVSQARTLTRQCVFKTCLRWLLWWVVIPEISCFYNEKQLIGHSCRQAGSQRRRELYLLFFSIQREYKWLKEILPGWDEEEGRQTAFITREYYYSLWYQAGRLTGWLFRCCFFLLWAILFTWESSEGQKEEWAEHDVKQAYGVTLKCLLFSPLLNSLCCGFFVLRCQREESDVSIGPRVPLHSYVWAAQCWRRDGVRRSAQKQYCEEKWKTKNARDKKSFKSLCTYFSVGRYSTKCCY